MKYVDKKLSDDFSKFLDRKLFYKNDKPLKQTKSKLKFFNECTTVVEEFINTFANKEPEPTSSSSSKINKSTNVNVMSIKVKNPIAAEHGCTVMTPGESMKADDERCSGVKKNE